MKRVLFYDDTPDYGGHQVTAVAAAKYVTAGGTHVTSAFDARNARMHQAWAAVQSGITLEPLQLALTRWQPFLSPFGIAARPVRALLTRVQPDVVVAVQGTIVQSTRVVEQCRSMGIAVVSFVPMGVHFAPGLWLQSFIAARITPFHYSRPDAFLTTSETSKGELIAGGARAPIAVVYYGPDLDRLRHVPRVARRRYTVALIGRVVIGTKGHDVMLRALRELLDVDLLIVGDGPDDARVDAMIAALGIGERVQRMPWQDDMSAVYSMVDMVVVPSRFEGLPLVVNEAMHYGLPVVAANVGAMHEVLPADWLFAPGDANGLAATIERVRRADTAAIVAANRELVLRRFNERTYGLGFCEALEQAYETIRRSKR